MQIQITARANCCSLVRRVCFDSRVALVMQTGRRSTGIRLRELPANPIRQKSIGRRRALWYGWLLGNNVLSAMPIAWRLRGNRAASASISCSRDHIVVIIDPRYRLCHKPKGLLAITNMMPSMMRLTITILPSMLRPPSCRRHCPLIWHGHYSHYYMCLMCMRCL